MCKWNSCVDRRGIGMLGTGEFFWRRNLIIMEPGNENEKCSRLILWTMRRKKSRRKLRYAKRLLAQSDATASWKYLVSFLWGQEQGQEGRKKCYCNNWASKSSMWMFKFMKGKYMKMGEKLEKTVQKVWNLLTDGRLLNFFIPKSG